MEEWFNIFTRCNDRDLVFSWADNVIGENGWGVVNDHHGNFTVVVYSDAAISDRSKIEMCAALRWAK